MPTPQTKADLAFIASNAMVNGVKFNFTSVQHGSARGLGDRSQTLWSGWAVLGPDFHWYFSGDAGYSADFADLQKRIAKI